MTRRLIPNYEPAQSIDDSEPLSGRIYSTGFGINVRTSRTLPQDDDVEDAVKKVFYTIVTTKLLIPGDGEPVKDAALVVKNKVIEWVGRQEDLPSEYTTNPHKVHDVPYLMPGLWDCHVHFSGINDQRAAEEGSVALAFLADHPATSGARLARGCWDAIQRGYTSMRDLAGFGCEVSKAIEDGVLVGPNIYSAGACLSQLAGHGDLFALPAGDVLLNMGVGSIKAGEFGATMSCIVDGVDECRRGVRLQIRRGARCIKVMASGGVLSRDDNPLYAQFSREELDAIISEAKRMERTVAAHVHGKPGIIQAVEAGVTSVEHVSYADQECVDLIKEKGTIFVATRTIVNLILDSKGEGIPKKSYEKAKKVGAHSLEGYKKAIKAGCTFALGTDTEPGFNMAIELQYAVEAGMSNLEAIKAATANGPLTVAGQVPLTGQLKVGYEADMIGVCENPVEDVKVLQKKSNIGWVWKGGKLFKGPGIGPWGEEL
ncbi:amidohydrolase [Pochonia chlamydosporia 170]|uniref:Amidohydrolase n=1 Tax=Pochonia chlamydosporia 170 TaxID=1380566 RepID=A0A179FKT8_METCM|nr:amidohydrolase [Pochonia chlamydosporia 170]OAQ66245.1 amidohydrolase [Pochonia chlamydosporia 170]